MDVVSLTSWQLVFVIYLFTISKPDQGRVTSHTILIASFGVFCTINLKRQRENCWEMSILTQRSQHWKFGPISEFLVTGSILKSLNFAIFVFFWSKKFKTTSKCHPISLVNLFLYSDSQKNVNDSKCAEFGNSCLK